MRPIDKRIAPKQYKSCGSLNQNLPYVDFDFLLKYDSIVKLV